MFCSKCGKQQSDDSVFCIACGATLLQPQFAAGAPRLRQTGAALTRQEVYRKAAINGFLTLVSVGGLSTVIIVLIRVFG